MTNHEDGPLVADPEDKVQRKHYKMFAVVFYNDDYTPMEFVVDMLKMHFGHNEETATMIMFDVHTKGEGIAGTYAKDIAETKAAMVMHYAKEDEHPLQVTTRQV